MGENKERGFYPFDDQVEIIPFKSGRVLSGEEKATLEAGEVIAVGKSVTFLKVGDIVHFEAFGCSKTVDVVDGKEHFVVSVNSHVIRGKHARE